MAAFETFVFYTFLLVVTLAAAKKKNWEKTIAFLGLGKAPWKKTLLDSFSLFVVIFALLSALALILAFVGLDDSNKVSLVVSSLSTPAIIVAVTLGPFAEEVFFRGFLQKYAGVVVTALLFALLHYSFGSATEMIGAFIAGIVLGYWVNYRNPSLWPVVLAHAGYNAASIATVMLA